jgi:Bacterial toxin 46
MGAGRKPGSVGTPSHWPAIDRGTLPRIWSPLPGPLIALDSLELAGWVAVRIADVLPEDCWYSDGVHRVSWIGEAWDLGCDRYMSRAIIAQTEVDFHDALAGIIPGVEIALGILVTTTALGGGVGSLFGGVGAAPGAVVGFGVGLELLEALGVGFLCVYVGKRMWEVESRLGHATSLAWQSRGAPIQIDRAAREDAEAVGLFFGLVFQALAAFVAKEGMAKALEMLGKSRFGAALAAWLQRTKWTGDLQFWFDELGSPKASPVMRQRLSEALEFLKDRRFGRENLRFRGMDLSKETNYLRGIDLHREVRVRTLSRGTELVQFRKIPGSTGNFFSEVGASPHDLGIDPAGRNFVRYVLTKDIPVLESTAAEFRMQASSAAEHAAFKNQMGDYTTGYIGRGKQFTIDNEALANLDVVSWNPAQKVPPKPAP